MVFNILWKLAKKRNEMIIKINTVAKYYGISIKFEDENDIKVIRDMRMVLQSNFIFQL